MNPTREEVLGLVNVEAQACGIPVITFRTGGSPECIDENSGVVVDSYEEMLEAIINNNCADVSRITCINSACRFSEKVKYGDYIKLYSDMVGGF